MPIAFVLIKIPYLHNPLQDKMTNDDRSNIPEIWLCHHNLDFNTPSVMIGCFFLNSSFLTVSLVFYVYIDTINKQTGHRSIENIERDT